MKQPIQKQPLKTCSCGKQYNEIPDSAKRNTNSILPGWYFNCACGSTLVIPLTQIRAALMIAVSFLFVACGGSGKDSAPNPAGLTCNTLAGTYDSDWHPGETLTINNDCTFTDSYCAYDASYTVPTTLDNGATVITVRNTNGCIGGMSSTDHMCVIEKKNGQLGINCDSGAHLFLFSER